MAWLILTSVVAIVCFAAACPHSHLQQAISSDLSGTNCSVFNYSKRCCLPEAECVAVDGNRRCSCSPGCYTDDSVKCCEDIHCPTSNSNNNMHVCMSTD